MNLRVSESYAHPQESAAGRRQHADGRLVLSELNPLAVIDRLDDDSVPLNLLTFGSVREICPKCRQTHLKLVLRQNSVRMAHLFCADCESCFDAHYANGAPALTI
ncbi:hypothetical protein LK542_02185 [Massilia sp. IC2-477]|uniref:hypothetical protein n=1 Tax=Massilia sp. IC2-477 TaxID=2887198 RepID=UPI001D1154DB|nr:hypothetical protein [Massilia sp. IC2-477]MCC2954419.1 hypothetical protein [Massilia sp. IC2-477]